MGTLYQPEGYPAEAPLLAEHWHGGQWSPLYAFLSTGTVEPGLSGELCQCLASAERHAPEDIDALREFLQWANLAEDSIPES